MSTTVTKARESPYLLALAANPTFVSGLVAWAVAQAAKAVLSSFVERRWDVRTLFRSGAMLSSHTALCTALTASVALCRGVSDALFPVCLCV
jgi:acid phosphatase family membrane protein YuiD